MDTENLDEDLPASPEGPLVLSMQAVLPNKQNYAAVIEYGTVPPEQVFTTLMEDNWVHAHGKLDTEQGRAAKDRMKECFYPSSDKWKGMIWERSVWSINCAVKLLRDETA